MTYHMKVTRGLLIADNNKICTFCNKECKNANSQRNHSRLCKHNPNRDTSYIMKYHKGEVTIPPFKRLNQYTKAESLGLPKPILSEETKQKLSIASKNRTPEQIKKQANAASKTIKQKVARGEWHTSLAKNMHHNYMENDLHGSWELKYAQYLDSQGIKWSRCKESFPYIFENKPRNYTPDFYLIETDEYVEIKGFKTEKDEAKWTQFPKKLLILREEDLKKLKII